MDRISTLPPTILSKILSNLPIDAAFQTKILNKRWRNLRFSNTELVFCQRSGNRYPYPYLSGIASFMRKAFPLGTSSTINKFELKLLDKHVSELDIDILLKGAISRHVKHIAINIHGNGYFTYSPREWLCSYEPLESLVLRNTGSVNSRLKLRWTSLKALTLGFMYFNDGVLKNIFDGCPKLDYLELDQLFIHGTLNIDIDFRSCLKKLVIVQRDEAVRSASMYNNRNTITISMPKVVCLVLKLLTMVELIDISSLVDVSIDYHELESDPYYSMDFIHSKKKNLASDWLFRDERDIVREDRRDIFVEFLNKVSHAEIVQLGPWCVKAASSFIWRALPSHISLLPKCKYLVLETPVGEWDIPGILDLLKSSPGLEALVVDLTTGPDYNLQFLTGTKIGTFNANTYWKKQKNYSEQFLEHLKYVKIVGLSTRLVGLAQFLLENAKCLERMVLTNSKSKNEPSSVIQKILNLPKPSPNAQIIIS